MRCNATFGGVADTNALIVEPRSACGCSAACNKYHIRCLVRQFSNVQLYTTYSLILNCGVGRRSLGVGCWESGVGCRVSVVGCRVMGVGCRASGAHLTRHEHLLRALHVQKAGALLDGARARRVHAARAVQRTAPAVAARRLKN